MQTTPRDYALFLSALMRGEVLSPSARGKMLSPQMMLPESFFATLAAVENTC
jgi:hypothetical protein